MTRLKSKIETKYCSITTNSLKKLYFKVLSDRERETERPLKNLIFNQLYLFKLYFGTILAQFLFHFPTIKIPLLTFAQPYPFSLQIEIL